jgi:hypothetical protein
MIIKLVDQVHGYRFSSKKYTRQEKMKFNSKNIYIKLIRYKNVKMYYILRLIIPFGV